MHFKTKSTQTPKIYIYTSEKPMCRVCAKRMAIKPCWRSRMQSLTCTISLSRRRADTRASPEQHTHTHTDANTRTKGAHTIRICLHYLIAGAHGTQDSGYNTGIPGTGWLVQLDLQGCDRAHTCTGLHVHRCTSKPVHMCDLYITTLQIWLNHLNISMLIRLHSNTHILTDSSNVPASIIWCTPAANRDKVNEQGLRKITATVS